MTRIVSNVPPGYNMLPELNGYAAHSGPYFWSKDADGGLIYGFQSDERHGNPNGVLHGGAIVTFVDTALGHICDSDSLRLVDRSAGASSQTLEDTRFPRCRGNIRGNTIAYSDRHISDVLSRRFATTWH
jgi:hypothetical protein